MGASFAGYASVHNVVDLQGEVIDPGAWVNLAAWLKAGTLLWEHMRGVPVGYPTEARDDGVGLFIRGTFHSTPEGQAAETWASERKAAGLDIALSVGYLALAQPRLVAGAVHLTKLALLEVSFVGFPANQHARLTTMKSRAGELLVQPGPRTARTATTAEIERSRYEAGLVGVRT